MQTYINFMGSDFILEIDWTLIHPGSPPITYGPPENCDPGCDPEWEINYITLTEDRPSARPSAPAFEATGELFKCLAFSRTTDDAILTYLCEHKEDENYYYDED